MFKVKGLLTIALLSSSAMLFSSASFATNCPSKVGDELYFGVGAGPEHANFKQRVFFSLNSPFPLSDVRVIDKNHFAGKGQFVSIYAGYGMKFATCGECADTYLGLELNANSRRVRYRRTNEEFLHLNLNEDTYRMKRDFGVSILPGIIFNEKTLFYARLGYANGRFKTTVTDETLQSIQKNRDGFRYGLGFRQTFCECLAFRIEYSQTKYVKSKMFYNLSSPPAPVAIVKSTMVTPYTHRFELGLMYMF